MATEYDVYRARMDLMQTCLKRISAELGREEFPTYQANIDRSDEWVDDMARQLVSAIDSAQAPEVSDVRNGPTGVEVFVNGRWVHLCYSDEFEAWSRLVIEKLDLPSNSGPAFKTGDKVRITRRDTLDGNFYGKTGTVIAVKAFVRFTYGPRRGHTEFNLSEIEPADGESA